MSKKSDRIDGGFDEHEAPAHVDTKKETAAKVTAAKADAKTLEELRDVFAARALQGLVCDLHREDVTETCRRAWEYADGMLATREKDAPDEEPDGDTGTGTEDYALPPATKLGGDYQPPKAPVTE